MPSEHFWCAAIRLQSHFAQLSTVLVCRHVAFGILLKHWYWQPFVQRVDEYCLYIIWRRLWFLTMIFLKLALLLVLWFQCLMLGILSGHATRLLTFFVFEFYGSAACCLPVACQNWCPANHACLKRRVVLSSCEHIQTCPGKYLVHSWIALCRNVPRACRDCMQSFMEWLCSITKCNQPQLSSCTQARACHCFMRFQDLEECTACVIRYP